MRVQKRRVQKRRVRNQHLEDYMRRSGERYRTLSALAQTIGMSASALNRAVHVQGTLSLENCLRLADTFGDDPCVVLRAAGKLEEAALLERLRGKKAVISQRARDHVAQWQRLSPKVQDAVESITRDAVIGEAVMRVAP
jgi:plasmid maintenance system antidote protein VapI